MPLSLVAPAVQLVGILPPVKPNNQMASNIFGFLDWISTSKL